MTTTTYQVQGMTCGHCVRAIKGVVGALDGVRSVDAEVTTGAVVVTSDAPLDPERVRAAVAEAGYEVVG
jgi:copper ion binding protein